MAPALTPFRPRAAIAIALAAMLSGCSFIDSVIVKPAQTLIAPVVPAATPAPQREGRQSSVVLEQLLSGIVTAPRSLSKDGHTVVGKGPTTAYRTVSAFGLLADGPGELPVHFATVTPRGYDLRALPLLLGKVTDAEGKFTLKDIPPQVVVFLETTVEVDGKLLRLFGVTRTEDIGVKTEVTIDVASTLLARELMRILQLTDHRVSFRELSPKDFLPLLLNLRAVVQGGIPDGLSLDLTKIAIPTGAWSLDRDRTDSALMLLDQLSSRYRAVDDEVNRLYKAANYNLTHSYSDDQVLVARPASLLASPAPK